MLEQEQALEGEFFVLPENNSTEILEAELEGIAEPPPLGPQTDSELVTVDWSQQRVILPEGAQRGDAVQILTKAQPLNAYGLPMGYIRSDLLPYELELLTQGEVDAATVKLDYNEGYPTTPKGSLFWSKLDHEPFEAFVIFQRYIAQAEELGIRQLEMLANHESKSLLEVQALYKEFLWSVRAKAHDLFQAAADKKRRELRIRSTENKHFMTAETLMEQLLPFFDDPEWIANISPVEAIEILEKLAKLQRLSLGLTGQNASSFQAPNGGQSVEVIMRSLVGQGGGNGQTAELGQDLQQLMANPEFGMMAQELIIRATRSNTPITTNSEAGFG